jgi:glycosyltransferase involved in cell wall biosynthesis
MRLAICMEYPLMQTGGVEVLVRELVRGLSREFEVVLVSDDDDASLEASGLAGSVVAQRRWAFGLGTPHLMRQLIDDLRCLGVSVAHFHFGGPFAWGIRDPRMSPMWRCRRAGLRPLFTNHWVRGPLDGYVGEAKPASFKAAMFPLAQAARLWNLVHAEAEIVVSDADLRIERSNTWPLADKVSRIYHSRLSKAALEAPPPIRENIVLSLGTLAHRKGQDVLLEAFARVASEFPDWHLVFVGRGEPAFLELLGASSRRWSLDERVVFNGPASDPAQVKSWLHRAGIFVIPSRSEGLGLSLQEALWEGCPAIGTTAGGIPELIQHEKNGLLVAPGDPDALAKALRHLIGSPELRGRFGCAARTRSRECGMTVEDMLASHRRLYQCGVIQIA